MRYLFRGYDGQGVLVSQYVEATSEDEARAQCAFAESRLISGPRRAYIADLLGELTKSRLPADAQALFLAQLGAAIKSGQSANRTFIRLMRDNRYLRKQIPSIENELLVSRRLAIIGLDGQSVLMAEIGERTSTLGGSLLRASETMLWRRDLIAEMRKGIIPSLLMILISLSVLCSISLFMAPMIRDFGNQGGLEVTLNKASYALIGINDFLRGYWWALAAVAAAIGLYRQRIADTLLNVKSLDTVVEYFKLQRGIRFLTAFKPLFDVGVSTRKALTQLSDSGSARDRITYKAMIEGVERGMPLSEVLDRDEWPQIIREGFRNFEKADESTQDTILDTQLTLIQTRTRVKANLIRRILVLLSMAVTLTAIFLMTYGGYLALASAKPATGV